MNEIKKAWETMKKDLKKEFPNEETLHGGFTMNARQINNRTATYVMFSDWEYDKRIDYCKDTMNRILSYDTWTDEEKARSVERDLALIKKLEDKKVKYGDRKTEVSVISNLLLGSNAFKKFKAFVGDCYTEVSVVDGAYVMRFHY